MTIVALLLFGAGVIFIQSAVECCSLRTTFNDVLHGSVSFNMNKCDCSSGTSTSSQTSSTPSQASSTTAQNIPVGQNPIRPS